MTSSPFLCCTISGNQSLPDAPFYWQSDLPLGEAIRPFFLLPDSDTIIFNGEGNTVKVVAISHPTPKKIAIFKNAALTPRAIDVMTKSIAPSGRRKSLPYLIMERWSQPHNAERLEFAVCNTDNWSPHTAIDPKIFKLAGPAGRLRFVLSPSGTKIAVAGNDGEQVLLQIYDIPTKRITHRFVTTDHRLQWVWTPDELIVMLEAFDLIVCGLGAESGCSGEPAPLETLSTVGALRHDHRDKGTLTCSPDGRFVGFRYRKLDTYDLEVHAVVFQIKTTKGSLFSQPVGLFDHGASYDDEAVRFLFSPVNHLGLSDTLCIAVCDEETFMLSFKAAKGWEDGNCPLKVHEVRGGIRGIDARCISGDGSLIYGVGTHHQSGEVYDAKGHRSYGDRISLNQFAMAPAGRMIAYGVNSAEGNLVVVQRLDSNADDTSSAPVESKRPLPWPMFCAQIEFTADGRFLVYRGDTSDIFVDYVTLGQTLENARDDRCAKLLPADIRARIGGFLLC